jgi:hypothetical protein
VEARGRGEEAEEDDDDDDERGGGFPVDEDPPSSAAAAGAVKVCVVELADDHGDQEVFGGPGLSSGGEAARQCATASTRSV